MHRDPAPRRSLLPVTTGQHRITDSQKPDRRDLEGNSEVPYQSISEDYAIIARYRDQVCGCPVIIAGGLGEYGTLAAGEFLSNNNYLREILPYAPKNWQKLNMEAVIATRVVNGNSGPPRVIDAYFW